MPIANAKALRLREALTEYINSITGDTGTRRGSTRAQINDDDRALVSIAQQLVQGLDGSGAAAVPAGQRDTAGSRTRDRAAAGEEPRATSGWGEATAAANALFGNAPGGGQPNNVNPGNGGGSQ